MKGTVSTCILIVEIRDSCFQYKLSRRPFLDETLIWTIDEVLLLLQ